MQMNKFHAYFPFSGMQILVINHPMLLIDASKAFFLADESIDCQTTSLWLGELIEKENYW